MNKTAKRIIAGVSAAVMFVSAVGVGTFTNSFMKTSYADSGSTKGKNGKSTGFSNLEQDTDKDNNYNTGYGLHTNKTARVADGTTDGRTFDVDLESWYVGENPVDVATVLDASGSMAWTVDTLDPLEINDKEISEILGNKDYDDDGDCDIQDAIAYQNTNGGYLPQDVVDKILDPNNTDNSKLSYAGYKYYVYEARSSVAEFVPLGYWDGGKDELSGLDIIGYYPFEGSLENKASNIHGKSATYIKHAEETGNVFGDEAPMQIIEPTFVDGDPKTLDLRATAENGGLMLDINTPQQFTIAMRIKADTFAQDQNKYEELPFFYIGDLNGENYIKLVRSGSDARNLKVYHKGTNIINYSGETKKPFHDADWVNVCLSYDGENIVINEYDNSLNTSIGSKSYTLVDFPTDNMKIIIGGDIDGHAGNYSDMQLSEFCVFNKALSGDDLKTLNTNKNIKSYSDIEKIGGLVGFYDFGDDPTRGQLDNIVSSGSLTFIEQAKDGVFSHEEITNRVATPTYSSEKYNGSHSLNVTQTSKWGSVLLDAHPKGSSYTLSFAIRKKEDTTNDNKQFEKNSEIMYIGSSKLEENEYYSIRRNNHNINDDRHLRFINRGSGANADINNVFQNENKNLVWSYITYVFDNGKLRVYKDGEIAPSTSGGKVPEIELESLSTKEINFIIAGLKEEYDGSDIFIDDLYVFDKALTADEVEIVYNNETNTAPTKETCGQYHAVTTEGVEIAQIDDKLMTNSDISERRGWYYVNSHSKWEDIEGCLESGKQYVGIVKEDGDGEGEYVHTDEATIPDALKNLSSGEKNYPNIKEGDNQHDEYVPPEQERSIRFYVDDQNHLRCFVHAGGTSKEGDPRTFCSLVYSNIGDKPDDASGDDTLEGKMKAQEAALKTYKDASGNETYRESITKYEKLNVALNLFYEQLAENSDLTNTAIMRFSTHNMVKDLDYDSAAEKMQELTMQNWTSWSTYLQEYRQNTSSVRPDPEKSTFLQDVLIPDEGETSVPDSSSGGQYPYVMTGGTYTWTALKSFYENMVKDKTGTTNKDIATDGRDKYLIIFTDGRDNTQDSTLDEDTEKLKEDGANYKDTDYVGNNKPEGSDITMDGQLAKAWADKLKEEGYTIYCVMMATGSISETANEDEYKKAYAFLKTLAGSNEGEEKDLFDPPRDIKPDDWKKNVVDKYVLVTKPSSTDIKDTAVGAFQDILEDIQQPRDDYTVQDYIDPRFDLIDKNGNIYKLGAGGKITITDKDGNAAKGIKLSNGTEFTNGTAIGNIIDKSSALGLEYTPQASEMVNRKQRAGGYDDGDGVGTGYIYYDDVKDMYYLRWTNQIIPMEDESFTTGVNPYEGKYLDVWSATIRLKAKDDFIGGNDILTNGNEAGENLVFSTKTLELMKDNWAAYKDYEGDYANKLTSPTYNEREALQTLSGTNRKINAIDAEGVSQAVYGEGMNVPSSGFPRTVVNVKLLPIMTKPLHDIIYMGEVISPTMMLADIEDGYMSGSYYLQYLERYAYRLYGSSADKTPLIDLLNEWLRINDIDAESKTFTIPYIYLPAPKYDENGKLVENEGKVEIENNTGWDSELRTGTKFTDLNLQDITGFITYTWKRNNEEPQQYDPSSGKTDITKEYVVKDTNQIVYNLQLTFTPLKDENLPGFTLEGKNFIPEDDFFSIDKSGGFENLYEFVKSTEEKWVFTNRFDYLKAMVSETHTYKPAVAYNGSTEKWQFVGDIVLPSGKTVSGMEIKEAIKYYIDLDKETGQTTSSGTSDEMVNDKGAYDWDSVYKKVAGKSQIDGDATYGNATISADKNSLEANTTYVKDVVNGALALELVVDGKYLQDGSPITVSGKTYTFEATRYYDDPLDPLPYGANEKKNADTGDANAVTGVDGKNYQLTFKVDPGSIPTGPKPDELYTVWAKLTEVKVKDSTGAYKDITETTTADNPYLGYAKADSLPIGTYVISTENNALLSDSQFKIGTDGPNDIYFEHLKLDNASSSYTYNRFPDSVYEVSSAAAKDTGDNEYLINNAGVDNAPKNIADCNRIKNADKQELTFHFGTVAERTISGTKLTNTKGYDRNDTINYGKDYAKDRLGIILLSVNPNSLVISKKVTNTKDNKYNNEFWDFNITFKPNNDTANMADFEAKNGSSADGFDLTWYKGGVITNASAMGSDYPNPGGGTSNYPEKIKFEDLGDGTYTATIYLKHNEKVRINGLPEGTWQVTEEENSGLFYSPHNNAHGLGDGEWEYERADATSPNIQLNPASHVDFVNEFPYELPSAGGIGVDQFVFFGTVATVTAALTVIASYYKRRKRRRIN